MNSLDSMLRRNKDLAAQAVCCGDTYALAPAGAAKCKGDHHWLR